MKIEINRKIIEVFEKFNYMLFDINSEGTKIMAMNPTRTVAITMLVSNIKSDEAKKIGVSMRTISKIAKRAGKNDKIELDFGEDTIGITIHSKLKRTFKIPYESIDPEEILGVDSIPLENFTRIEGDPRELLDYIKDIDTINADFIRIKATKDSVELFSESTTMDYKVVPEWLSYIDDDKEISTTIGTDLIQNSAPFFRYIENAMFYIQNDAPLIVEGEIDGNKAYIAIAPRADV